jgi:hypothetical protein
MTNEAEYRNLFDQFIKSRDTPGNTGIILNFLVFCCDIIWAL